VTLHDAFLAKPGALKVPVDVAGKHESAMRQPRRHLPQDAKPLVRRGGAVKVQAMPIKPPRQPRLIHEPPWIGDFLEAQPRAPQRRISPPQPRLATKVRQPRIHPHTRARRDDQGIGLRQQSRSAGDGAGKRFSREHL